MNHSFKLFLKSSTARLAGTYLVIIMVMSIGFSLVFYGVSSQAVNRQPGPTAVIFRGFDAGNNQMRSADNLLRAFLDDRAADARRELIARLLLVNIVTLIIGAGISYLLARRTLRPIEANIEAQRQFVNDASHELRTPLTAIQTSNEVALRNPKLSLAQAKKLIGDNIAEVAKLKALSDGLLHLAKQDATVQPLDDVGVQTAVQTALNQVVAAALDKDIAVDDSSAPLTVRSNQPILSQILVIFLDNAIKYSPPGSTVFVTTSTKNGQAFIHVRDQGLGINKNDVMLIFRRFYRADNARTSSHENGYGLGLAIADKLASAHGMSLHVTSEMHTGSTFTIRLPLVK